jgi:hypothetical protein
MKSFSCLEFGFRLLILFKYAKEENKLCTIGTKLKTEAAGLRLNLLVLEKPHKEKGTLGLPF